jgi:hypothetical protein
MNRLTVLPCPYFVTVHQQRSRNTAANTPGFMRAAGCVALRFMPRYFEL